MPSRQFGVRIGLPYDRGDDRHVGPRLDPRDVGIDLGSLGFGEEDEESNCAATLSRAASRHSLRDMYTAPATGLW